MSIWKTMNIGLSGLNTNGFALSVIGNNIANVNTVGFKGSRANFEDILARTTLGAGSGARVSSLQQHQKQGSLEMTGNALDMAVSGEGFMVLNGNFEGQTQDYYTRAGQFGLDQEGFIVNQSGLRLQGYGVDADGNIGHMAGDMLVGDVTNPPNATTTIDLQINLNSDDEVLDTSFDASDPTNTSNFSSSVTLYDSLGTAIPADVYYNKTGENTWEYHVLVDGEHVGGMAGEAQEIESGNLSFDTDGSLLSHSSMGGSFMPTGATSPQPLVFDLTGSTQYSSDSVLRVLSQDGYGVGELRDLDIATDGTIMGIFSNGESQALGQVVLADFAAPEGLDAVGGNLWRQSSSSGEALTAAASSGGRGALHAGFLESSNVDMAHEFIRLIAAQRGFQASSKTVQTADQMLSEAINIKR